MRMQDSGHVPHGPVLQAVCSRCGQWQKNDRPSWLDRRESHSSYSSTDFATDHYLLWAISLSLCFHVSFVFSSRITRWRNSRDDQRTSVTISRVVQRVLSSNSTFPKASDSPVFTSMILQRRSLSLNKRMRKLTNDWSEWELSPRPSFSLMSPH